MTLITEIIEHEVDQRSEEWFNIRAGKLTGSHFAEIMPSARAKTAWTQAQEKVLYRIAAEILTGEAERNHFVSDAMQWGIDHEDEAREELEMEVLMNSRECGIFQRGEFFASSPDAILGDNEITLEIKCPSSAVHLQYLKDPGKLWETYRWQCVGEMVCTGIDKCCLISYDPRFKDPQKRMVIYTPEDTVEDRAKLEARLDEFEERLKELIK